MAINAQELQGQWNTLRGQVKQKWGQLTDDDLQIQGGNVDQLVGRIQQKTGEGRESIERFLDELTATGSSSVAQTVESVGNYARQAGGRPREQYGYDQPRSRFGGGYANVRERYAEVREEDVAWKSMGMSVAHSLGGYEDSGRYKEAAAWVFIAAFVGLAISWGTGVVAPWVGVAAGAAVAFLAGGVIIAATSEPYGS
jgi:uncharacterized protein YjbJ (UPF0337 family)